MQSKTSDTLEAAMWATPAYRALEADSALILGYVLAYLKRTFRQGRLDEATTGWVDFPRTVLPFKVDPLVWSRALVDLEIAGFIEVRRAPGRPCQIAKSQRWLADGPEDSSRRLP